MANYIGQQIGNYRIERPLGRGGFAEVYLATHLHLKRQVAVKILHLPIEGRQQQRFAQEAQIIARLRHAHIIPILDFGFFEDQVPYLIMDYLSGGSLRSQHPQGTQLPLAQVIAYTRQIAEALQYAHTHHIIHQDVKPENVLLSEMRDLVLADFGLALVIESAASLSDQKVAGTPRYMAPEQLQGKPCYASDQYSLAICVYEWLCGAVPFLGAPFVIMHQHLCNDPPPLRQHLSSLPQSVENVILKALNKAPNDRFPSVQAFLFALEQAALQEKSYSEAHELGIKDDVTLPMDQTLPSRSHIPVSQIPPFLPGLDEIDNQVMKLFCDEAMLGGHYWVNAESLVDRAENIGIQSSEFFDSIRVLGRRGYLEVKEALGGHIGLVKIQAFGFEYYARSYIDQYEEITNAVIRQLANGEPLANTDLAHLLSQPEMVINHILLQLANEKLINVFEVMGRENNIRVYDVSPELKRRKKSSA